MLQLLTNSELKNELVNNIPSYLATKTFEKHFIELTEVYENLF